MINKIFKSARLLNRDSDKNLKISPLQNYKFTAETNLISISVNEISEASKHYPIMFIKNSEGIIPVALLSLMENSNKSIDADGNWIKPRYIPALFRAYPFALSKNGENFSIAIDDKYEGINQDDGKNFFNEDGSNSELGEQVSNFLQETYKALETTKTITKTMDEMKLFSDSKIELEQNGKKFVLEGLLRIDSNVLNQLDDDNLLKLVKLGAFNTIYAHLNSLSNMGNIL